MKERQKPVYCWMLKLADGLLVMPRHSKPDYKSWQGDWVKVKIEEVDEEQEGGE